MNTRSILLLGQCSLCRIRIGPDLETKYAVPEPLGTELVCTICYRALDLRRMTVYEALKQDGAIRERCGRRRRRR